MHYVPVVSCQYFLIYLYLLMILIYKFCNVISLYLPKTITCDSLHTICSRQVLDSTTDEIPTRIISLNTTLNASPAVSRFNSIVSAKCIFKCYLLRIV